MIFDAENMFYDAKDLTTGSVESNVLSVGPGEAGCPLILYAQNGGTGSGTLSLELKTSETEDFSDSTTLATFTEFPVKAPLPRGNKGYLKLVAASTYTAGTITAGLVLDDDILE